MFGFYISKTICNLVGYLIPAYSTYRAIQNKHVESYNSMIVFWIVMAVFSVVELFGDLLISWLPLYYESKIVFIVWLSLPQTKGAERIYSSFLEPWLRKNESHIDAHAVIVTQHISDGVAHLRSSSMDYIKSKSVEILTMSTQLVASANSSANTTPQTKPLGAFAFESPTSRRESNAVPPPSVPTQTEDEVLPLPVNIQDGVTAGLRSRKK